MRYTLALLLTSFAAACASGGGDIPDGAPHPRPDAMDVIDAPPGTIDADVPPTPDAPPGTPDAMVTPTPDAMVTPTPDAGPPPPTTMVISEVRTRGAGGAADEFVELYNAGATAVTLDTSWHLEARSTTSASFSTRWTGVAGVMVPSHAHYLVGGAGYTVMPTKDASLSSGITDASAVRLIHGTATIDEICLQYDATTLAAYDATFTCEGTPMSNLPHNNGTSGASNSDASVERLPGGALGNGTDTNDNATDFVAHAPASPQNLASAPTP